MAIKNNKQKRATDHDKNALNKRSHDGLARFITNTFGSLAFLLVYVLFIAGWIAWNHGWLGLKPFDKSPFSELELFLSAFAIFLSVMVLISQKRQARLEKINERVEFEVNLKSEKEITKVLEMLQRIQQKLGIDKKDPELDKMMEELDTEKIHQQHKKADEG
jgi:uncharacterized membrane protein